MSLVSDIKSFSVWLAPQARNYTVGIAALFGVNLSDVLAPIFMAVATVSHAEPLIKKFPGELSANVAFTTEYFFRGLSQADDGTPAVQGGLLLGKNGPQDVDPVARVLQQAQAP